MYSTVVLVLSKGVLFSAYRPPMLCFQVQSCSLEHGGHDEANDIDAADGFGALESAFWSQISAESARVVFAAVSCAQSTGLLW